MPSDEQGPARNLAELLLTGCHMEVVLPGASRNRKLDTVRVGISVQSFAGVSCRTQEHQ